MTPIAKTMSRRTKRNAAPICQHQTRSNFRNVLESEKLKQNKDFEASFPHRPRSNNSNNSRYCTKQKKQTNHNEYISTSRKFPVIIFPENKFHKHLIRMNVFITIRSAFSSKILPKKQIQDLEHKVPFSELCIHLPFKQTRAK